MGKDIYKLGWRYVAGAAQGCILAATFSLIAFLFVHAKYINNPDGRSFEQWRSVTALIPKLAVWLLPFGLLIQHRPLLPALATKRSAVWSTAIGLASSAIAALCLWYFFYQLDLAERLRNMTT